MSKALDDAFNNAKLELEFIIKNITKDDVLENAEFIHEVYQEIYERMLWEAMGSPEDFLPIEGEIITKEFLPTGVCFDSYQCPPDEMARKVIVMLGIEHRKN